MQRGALSGETSTEYTTLFPDVARRVFLKGLAVASLTTLSGCGPTFSYRYRLRAIVDTPQGTREGSSVREVRLGNNLCCTTGGFEYAYGFDGEALAVDLPTGTLFVLLGRYGYDQQWSYRGVTQQILQEAGRNHWDKSAMEELPEIFKSRKTWLVPGTDCPLLVHFMNLNNPKTLSVINANDLQYVFGRETWLRELRIELTSEPITKTIRQRLPWLPENGGSAAIIQPPSSYEKNTITYDSFRHSRS